MEIRRLSLISGALRAEGLAVIIDVFRAFTTAAYVMANGASGIIPVATVEEANMFKAEDDDFILIGEVDGVKVEGFDYGNSPYEIKELDFTGRTLVQRTSAGTQGIICARNADEILLGSFVTADAIVDYIKERDPPVVSLVAMGWNGSEPAPEDEYLAEYLALKLKEQAPNFHRMKVKIRDSSQGVKFFDQNQPQFQEGDYHAAMDLNRFNFVVRVRKDNGLQVEKV